jgi:chromatin remodeling complex protein RSC6
MTASTAAPTPVATPSANSVVEKKEKAPSTKKAASVPKEVAATAPAVTAPVVADDVDAVAEEGVAATEVSATEKLAAFAALLAAGNNVFVQLKNQFKVLEKSIQKELKFAQKVSSRKLKRSGNRKPSGFVCPTLISDELCAFLGQPAGTLLARTDVSREINAYIKANELKNATNGRQINADAKLTALLKLQEGDILTFFNLQRYLKSHFIKAEVAAAPAGASV